MRNKKLLTSAVALGTAAVLLLSGTFAWQSISQTAENETANIVNPGGRLHDDFDGSNKDIYVENFGDEPIFARVRLEEFLALVINQGKDYANTEVKLGSMVYTDATSRYTYTGATYVFDEDNRNADGSFKAGNEWWKWQVGRENSKTAYYMPTFNKNKDSLAADVNGWYKNGIGAFGTATTKTIDSVVTSRNTEGGQYEGCTTYTAESTKTANAIYDIDRNFNDELSTLSAAALNDLIDGTTTYDENAVQLVEETHDAQQIGTTRGLISMDEWLDMVEAQIIEDVQAMVGAGMSADEADPPYDIEQFGNYWVYDTDGWVYWSAPIMPGTTTGLLLDGIQRTAVMDDSYYYGINVVAQFVTADDLGTTRDALKHGGNGDGTGFYDTSAGAKPTQKAEGLLWYITDPKVDAYAPDTYAVFYEHEGEDGAATTYRAYYLSANSVSDAEHEAWGLSEDMNIAWVGKAANVEHDSDYVKNTVLVQVGGKYIVSKSEYDDRLDNKVAPTGSMSGWFQNIGAETENGADFITGYYPSGDEVYTSTLDTSNVTDMSYLFKGAKFMKDSADGAPDEGCLSLAAWDTSSVTDMSHMFEDCANLVGLSPGSDWDTSSVTDMSYMFMGCTVLDEIVNAGAWNTSSVTDMSYMFSGCAALETLSATGWDTSSVTSMVRMFQSCTNLTEITGIEDWNVANVTNFLDCFKSCSSITELDLTGWNTQSATKMAGMFSFCTGLTTLTLGEDWTTANVTEINNMFKSCSSLTLDCSEWDVDQVTLYTGFNNGASSVTEPIWA